MWARAAWTALVKKSRWRFFADHTKGRDQFLLIVNLVVVTFFIGTVPMSAKAVGGCQNALSITIYSDVIAKLGNVRVSLFESVLVSDRASHVAPQFSACNVLHL